MKKLRQVVVFCVFLFFLWKLCCHITWAHEMSVRATPGPLKGTWTAFWIFFTGPAEFAVECAWNDLLCWIGDVLKIGKP